MKRVKEMLYGQKIIDFFLHNWKEKSNHSQSDREIGSELEIGEIQWSPNGVFDDASSIHQLVTAIVVHVEALLEIASDFLGPELPVPGFVWICFLDL